MALLTATAVALAGYAVVSLTGPDEAPEPEELVAEDAARPPPRPDRVTRKFIKPLFKSRAQTEPGHEDRSHVEPFQPPPPGPGQISPDDALVAFNKSLDAMDAALEGGRPSRKRKRELYSEATMAFTALSSHLDGRDPEQRAVLEEAHFEMKQRMKALKMKVPKRPGAVLESSGR